MNKQHNTCAVNKLSGLAFDPNEIYFERTIKLFDLIKRGYSDIIDVDPCN